MSEIFYKLVEGKTLATATKLDVIVVHKPRWALIKFESDGDYDCQRGSSQVDTVYLQKSEPRQRYPRAPGQGFRTEQVSRCSLPSSARSPLGLVSLAMGVRR